MPLPMLYLIGLTGNIACGKSTVLALLREQGARTLDADQVTHAVQQPGQPVYDQIVEAFGSAILESPGGPINRRALGAIVFHDPAQLRRLEQIVHPAVRERIRAWLAETSQQAVAAGQRRVVVLDAIKLIESGWTALCDAVWVVTSTPAQQHERLMRTRGLSAEEAQARTAAQPPQETKIAQATVLIDNSGSLDETRTQVLAAWERVALMR